MNDIEKLRQEYSKASLDSADINTNPIQQFQKWFNEAQQTNIHEPNAMSLATVSSDGRPSLRIVLLKGIENEKFLFYTNYQSKKGIQLAENPACALTFFWPELERQIRIEGVVERVSPDKSTSYFQSRPRGSQLGAWVSPQSSTIKGRAILEERLAEMEKKFEGVDKLPKPQQWGGYAVTPHIIEFWQGRPNRLHDRLEFANVEGIWKMARLAP